MNEPSRADAVELGVRMVDYVNHAYVQGDEHELAQLPPQPTRITLVTIPATPEEKRRIIRNIGILSIAFMLSFMTKYGFGNLQSSLNVAEGLGTFSLAATYCGLVISNAILPMFMLRCLGSKWTVALSFLLMIPYIVVQYHPTFYTLLPASFLVGVVGAPMGVAANKFLAVTAQAYSDITGTAIELVIPRFFGTFLMFCQMAQVWGNLIPSVVIMLKERNVNTSEEFILENCGIYFYHNVAGKDPNFMHPRDDTVLLLVYIFMVILSVAIILASFGIDSLARFCAEMKESNYSAGGYGFEIMGATFKQLFLNQNLQLLVPITFWLGFEQAFMSADYTASYISCAWGLRDVGYVMAGYGITNALSSLAIRLLVKLTGRVPAVLIAFFLHIAIFATLILWHPNSSNRFVFFILTLVWGMSDSIWVVQIMSLYGILSPGKEEAAFSNYDLWLSLGFIVGFGISSVLYTYLKVYLMLGLLLIGMAAYLMMEWQRRRQKQSLTTQPIKDREK